tara:strand:+ start:67 stop:414 length:348 start_codon:yes stop_codon:yes gene_type:complete
MPGIKFGVDPIMREVPPGQHAVIQLGEISKWKIVDSEWGEKYSFPILLLSHPDYPNLDKPLKTKWESKSKVAEHLYNWIYDEGKIRTFDFKLEKEVYCKWKLTRHETGGYAIEQI